MTTTTTPGTVSTTPREQFDAAGFEQARKRSVIGAMLAKNHPNSLLLKTGVASSSAPDRADFTTTRTDTTVTPGTTTTTRSDGGGSSSSAKGQRFDLLEEFYNGGGEHIDLKNGQPIATVPNHEDHLHAASGPKQIQRIAQLAQSRGLTVRELAPFDKVDPVHVPGSNHYRNQAADISGDPQAVAKFARWLASHQKTRK